MNHDDCSTEVHPAAAGWLAACTCGWHHIFSIYSAASAAARAHTAV